MIRSALKRGIKKIVGMGGESAEETPRPPAPVARSTAAPAAAAPAGPVGGAPVVAAPAPAAPAASEVPAAPAAAQPMDENADTAGPPLSLEQVQEVLDDMVRPALQGDGGDITLIKIESNNIYVRLVGSCKSCPSSILTMKMGVEALLKEEFPAMNELIQVD